MSWQMMGDIKVNQSEQVVSSGFTQHLLAEALRYRPEDYPFVRGVCEGTMPREAVRSYAAEIATTTGSFLHFLAFILSRCDDLPARHLLLSNLLEEEGVVEFRSGNEMSVDPTRRHPLMARQFAQAAGATEKDFSQPPVHSEWLTNELLAGRWIGPLAFIAIGYEANIPPTFHALLKGLRTHYGFQDDELTYLSEHVGADERHSEHGAQVVASAAKTIEDQQEALKGV
ncbi:MAG TPA: iron-containing redox enzyme family protein, partial [Blastocatellia bacterium]|nr:iron-containing redox enzyme family protein [Blastocatellia bacterium]